MVIIIRKFILLIFSSIFILHSLLNMCWRQLSKCSREQNDSNFSSSWLNCAIHSKNFLIANISLIFTHTHTCTLSYKTVFIKSSNYPSSFLSVTERSAMCPFAEIYLHSSYLICFCCCSINCSASLLLSQN